MSEFSFEFDYAQAEDGFDIHCWLDIDGIAYHLRASPSFPPFLELLMFIQAVAEKQLPQEFVWNEEGMCATFLATAAVNNNSLVHLKITHEANDRIWFDAEVERQSLVEAFLHPLVDMNQNFLVAESEWGLPKSAVTDAQQKIALVFAKK